MSSMIVAEEQERIQFTWTDEEIYITVNNSEQGLNLVVRMKPSDSIGLLSIILKEGNKLLYHDKH